MSVMLSDIVIRIHTQHGQPVDFERLKHIFDLVELSLYSSDRRDIEHVSKELQIPSYIVDAALERLRRYRNRRIQIIRSGTGSILLDGTVAAVSLIVLNAVITEALKDAIKETDRYRRMKEFFRRNLDRKVFEIADGLRASLATKKLEGRVEVVDPRMPPDSRSSHPGEVSFDDLPERAYRIIIVDISIEESKEKRIPSLGEELDLSRDGEYTKS